MVILLSADKEGSKAPQNKSPSSKGTGLEELTSLEYPLITRDLHIWERKVTFSSPAVLSSSHSLSSVTLATFDACSSGVEMLRPSKGRSSGERRPVIWMVISIWVAPWVAADHYRRQLGGAACLWTGELMETLQVGDRKECFYLVAISHFLNTGGLGNGRMVRRMLWVTLADSYQDNIVRQ